MGVYLSEPEKSKKTIMSEDKNVAFCCSEMQGWRKNMEDAAIHELDLGDGNALFGVFDGHGGFQVSQYVSNQFKHILLKDKNYQLKDYTKALDEAFKQMDVLIESQQGIKALKQIRSQNNKGNGGGTGCTANVILITKQKIYCANAGDSRSVLCKNGGQIFDLSFDHKPESQEQEQRIVNAGGSIVMGRVNGGLNLTRSFGDFDYKRRKDLTYDQQMITCKPDIRQYNRSQVKDEFILMGCDGIWQRYVDNSKGLIDIVRNQLKTQYNLKDLVENLLENLLAKDTREGIGCDNMTCILIKFK